MKTPRSLLSVSVYLSLIALVGLGVNAVWHVTWADPVAGSGGHADDRLGRPGDNTLQGLWALLTHGNLSRREGRLIPCC